MTAVILKCFVILERKWNYIAKAKIDPSNDLEHYKVKGCQRHTPPSINMYYTARVLESKISMDFTHNQPFSSTGQTPP